MTKRLKTAVLCLFCAIASACLFSALFLLRGTVHAESAAETAHVQSYQTVAIHDPSIVLAYEDAAGNTLPERHSESDKKVYYIFGTMNSFAKSYDLVNWVNFQNNLNDDAKLFALLQKESLYSYHANGEELRGNIWAPDVIYNPVLEKWCMYLSVNGNMQYSSIVLLTADRLDGDWAYGGPIVYSRITSENIAKTDYTQVTGRSTVAAKYDMYRGGKDGLLYGVNAIDPAVSYDENG
ncbi:MAG: hypothetical protein K2J30_01800, partial [Clostridia bacterium]|nr:hypothetical protein [Clostridia bacterium]